MLRSLLLCSQTMIPMRIIFPNFVTKQATTHDTQHGAGMLLRTAYCYILHITPLITFIA